MARTISKDPVDLSITHLENVRRKAREIIAAVDSGVHPNRLGGTTLASTGGQLMSVPVGLRYRLTFLSSTLQPHGFFTHEAYNKMLRGPRWN